MRVQAQRPDSTACLGQHFPTSVLNLSTREILPDQAAFVQAPFLQDLTNGPGSGI